MPGSDRAPGGKGSARGGGPRHSALTVAKWTAALVLVCVASFLISLFWVGPRLSLPSREGRQGASLPARGDAPEERLPAAVSPVSPAAPEATGRHGLPESLEERHKSYPPGTSVDDMAAREPHSQPGDTTIPPGNSAVSVRRVPIPPGASTSSPAVSVKSAEPASALAPSPERGGARPGAAAGEPVEGESEKAPVIQGEAGEPQAPVSGSKGNLYKVEVGAPDTLVESESLAGELRKRGYRARVVTEGNIFTVRAGAFRNRSNAERLAAELGNKGYAATIAGGPGE